MKPTEKRGNLKGSAKKKAKDPKRKLKLAPKRAPEPGPEDGPEREAATPEQSAGSARSDGDGDGGGGDGSGSDGGDGGGEDDAARRQITIGNLLADKKPGADSDDDSMKSDVAPVPTHKASTKRQFTQDKLRTESQPNKQFSHLELDERNRKRMARGESSYFHSDANAPSPVRADVDLERYKLTMRL